jgi:signal transduction histidine kinase
MVSKKNSVLEFLIQEREKAQVELQRAHDLLEERVVERTAQLKTQITARKESELQSKAVLAERTRLAQELHDTLEQSLTGIKLQMETSAKLFHKNPSVANNHLELAMNLMSQSQIEVRRSIWDLRCRALEQFDLAGALRLSSRQMIDGTSIDVQVVAKGRVRPLTEIVEDNLLRIGQEALTNIIKHSEAKRATITLDYGPQTIVLRIEDNGKGFAPEHCMGPHQGHFGLLGISERTKRLRGRVSLTSAPGQGTVVLVEIPLESAPDLVPLARNPAQAPPAETNFSQLGMYQYE